jgi:flagellar motility protein MotE (MotC chaperone)
MNHIDMLEKKVHLAAQQLQTLRKDNIKLAEKIHLLEEENKAVKTMFGSGGDAWKHEKRALTDRVEKIVKRLTSIKLS